MKNYSNVKNDIILFSCLSIFLIFPCSGQVKNDYQQLCSRKTVDRSILKKLPKGICISSRYTIDQIIFGFDFNNDKKEDVVIRYSEYPLKDGIKRYYSIFQRVSDTVFVQKKELKNICPPYLSNIYATASEKDSVAFLVNLYPYDIEIEFTKDRIKLSHLIPEFYGKTYEFTFDKNADNWYLKEIQFWIGNLDERDIERMDLIKKLLNKNVIEVKKLNKRIAIDQFSLIESKKKASEEEKEYFMNKYNLFEWSTANK
jgi:hypothetical protein